MNWITKFTVDFYKLTKKQQIKNKTITYEAKQENLATEVPVALVYNGISHTVMMCSPENLADFAMGFSLAEGIIDKPSDIYGIDVVSCLPELKFKLNLPPVVLYASKHNDVH